MEKLEKDVKKTAKSIIQGNEKRKGRVKTRQASEFDHTAITAVEDALHASCQDIPHPEARRILQDKIYQSITQNMPYEHIPDVMCGRRQFYEHRNNFIFLVAKKMRMTAGVPTAKKGQN